MNSGESAGKSFLKFDFCESTANEKLCNKYNHTRYKHFNMAITIGLRMHLHLNTISITL